METASLWLLSQPSTSPGSYSSTQTNPMAPNEAGARSDDTGPPVELVQQPGADLSPALAAGIAAHTGDNAPANPKAGAPAAQNRRRPRASAPGPVWARHISARQRLAALLIG